MPEAGQILDAVILEEGAYTPTLTASVTNPTLGTSPTQSGWWKRVGNLIVGGAFIRFGTGAPTAGSGLYYISLPFPANTAFMIASDSTGLASTLGAINLRDNSVPAADIGLCWLAAAGNTVAMRTSVLVNNSGPWIWAASDTLSIDFAYQADPATL